MLRSMEGTARSAAARRLADQVAGGVAPEPFVVELADWLDEARMRAFVGANAPKVRHKLRAVAGDPEALRDVRAELAAAAAILADRRFELGFETFAASGAGPDFTVTFRTVVTFTLEVTRRRGSLDGASVVDASLAKLRQLPPSVGNVVLVAGDGPVDAGSIADAMRLLRSRVDGRESAILARVRAQTPRAFYERFLRLSAVVAWSETAPTGERVAVWVNQSARHAPDGAALRAIARRLAG